VNSTELSLADVTFLVDS